MSYNTSSSFEEELEFKEELELNNGLTRIHCSRK
jgi:hypothetical protein